MHSIARQMPPLCCLQHLHTQASSIPSCWVQYTATAPSTNQLTWRASAQPSPNFLGAAEPRTRLEQLLRASSLSPDRSPLSNRDAREEDLHRALDTTIGSLHTLGSLYKWQEMHWIKEKHRLDEEEEKVLWCTRARCYSSSTKLGRLPWPRGAVVILLILLYDACSNPPMYITMLVIIK